jgi:hypothetical protein
MITPPWKLLAAPRRAKLAVQAAGTKIASVFIFSFIVLKYSQLLLEEASIANVI